MNEVKEVVQEKVWSECVTNAPTGEELSDPKFRANEYWTKNEVTEHDLDAMLANYK